ncbi:hypothetical protein QYM36_015343 [Artemia franciscana]|uniref:Uncharacterized protein n=1 Tax=Artemia franciscana TaxID=6661 RepID=A0AA88H8Z1_ARTSF|nr:hypothetical protein QYM36_015343 [Artemia franciscana]
MPAERFADENKSVERDEKETFSNVNIKETDRNLASRFTITIRQLGPVLNNKKYIHHDDDKKRENSNSLRSNSGG